MQTAGVQHSTRLVIGTRNARTLPPGRRQPWLDTTRPRPRCAAHLDRPVPLGPDLVGRDTLTCNRAEGHRGDWHHDPRGYYWNPATGTLNRCDTGGHDHDWSEPWAEHVPARAAAVTGPAHRAGRRRPASAGRTRRP